MSSTPTTVQIYLADAVAERAPERLLLIGVTDEARARIAAVAPDNCTIVDQTPAAFMQSPDQGPRFDLAIVTHTLEHLASGEGFRLIGRIRDTRAGSVLVGVCTGAANRTDWSISAFIALGFRRSPASRHLADNWAIYRYDIHDYKTTPNWLNARYWANPERWGKQRW